MCIVIVVFMNVALVSGILLFSGSKIKLVVVVTSLTISVLSSLRFMNNHVPVDAYRESLQAIGESITSWRISEKFRLNTNESNALAAFLWVMVNFFWVFVSTVYVKKQSLVAETDLKINKMVVATPKLFLSLMLTYVLVPLSAAIPAFWLIATLQDNSAPVDKNVFFIISLLVFFFIVILYTSFVKMFHKKLIADSLRTKLNSTSQLLLWKNTEDPIFLVIIFSVFLEIIMFPFCVVFEIVNIIPWKKMGLNFIKVPNLLYVSRIGSDVIIPFALFGADSLSRSAIDACVKFNKKLTRSDSIQRHFYYPLLRVCAPVLAVFSSTFAIDFFAPRTPLDPLLLPGITGDNPLLGNFRRFELLLIVVATFFMTSHAVDVVQTAHTCAVYHEMAAREEEKKKLKGLLGELRRETRSVLAGEDKVVVELRRSRRRKGSAKRLVECIKNYLGGERRVEACSNPTTKV